MSNFDVYIKRALVLFYTINLISKFFSLSVDVTFGKLETETFFNSCLLKDYRAKYISGRKLENLLKLITSKHPYSTTTFIAHTTFRIEIQSYKLY